MLNVGAARPRSADYQLLKKVVLGGEGGWDYFEVDSQTTHRVFIPRDRFINVVDTSGKDLGTIPTPHGSKGLVIAPEFKHGSHHGIGHKETQVVTNANQLRRHLLSSDCMSTWFPSGWPGSLASGEQTAPSGHRQELKRSLATS